ncbi:hypothetical protein WDW89_13375 [Deltaproteobacteria bacterium TL4]
MEHRKIAIGIFILLEGWMLIIVSKLIQPQLSSLQFNPFTQFPLVAILLSGGSLFLATLLIGLAQRALSSKNKPRFRLWIVLSILLTLVFLNVEYYKGVTFFNQTNSGSLMFAEIPFLLCVLHWLQVLIALIWSLALLFTSWLRIGWQNIGAVSSCQYYCSGTVLLWFELLLLMQ